MKFIKLVSVFTLLLVSLSTQAQYGWRDGNRVGLLGGINTTSLITENINAKPEMGWTAGLQVRGNMYNYWSGVYGIRFIESNFSVNSKSLLSRNQEINYKLIAAQVHFLFSYNVIEDVMSFDFGPVLQINSDLKFKKGYEKYRIQDSNFIVEDLKKVTPFNALAYVGTTIGGRVVRVNINYTIGINNFFNRLNNQENVVEKNDGDNLKARMGVLSGQLQINL